jgi:hypothetical protein
LKKGGRSGFDIHRTGGGSVTIEGKAEMIRPEAKECWKWLEAGGAK